MNAEMYVTESRCARDKRRKFKLYLTSMALAITMIIGTAGASDQNIITSFEVFWQLGCSMVLGFGAWILMYINDKRACIHR